MAKKDTAYITATIDELVSAYRTGLETTGPDKWNRFKSAVGALKKNKTYLGLSSKFRTEIREGFRKKAGK